ncbi:MAG: hypothetical protein AAGF32_02670 [Pseudomonadota bacterium]
MADYSNHPDYNQPVNVSWDIGAVTAHLELELPHPEGFERLDQARVGRSLAALDGAVHALNEGVSDLQAGKGTFQQNEISVQGEQPRLRLVDDGENGATFWARAAYGDYYVLHDADGNGGWDSAPVPLHLRTSDGAGFMFGERVATRPQVDALLAAESARVDNAVAAVSATVSDVSDVVTDNAATAAVATGELTTRADGHDAAFAALDRAPALERILINDVNRRHYVARASDRNRIVLHAYATSTVADRVAHIDVSGIGLGNIHHFAVPTHWGGSFVIDAGQGNSFHGVGGPQSIRVGPGTAQIYRKSPGEFYLLGGYAAQTAQTYNSHGARYTLEAEPDGTHTLHVMGAPLNDDLTSVALVIPDALGNITNPDDYTVMGISFRGSEAAVAGATPAVDGQFAGHLHVAHGLEVNPSDVPTVSFTVRNLILEA